MNPFQFLVNLVKNHIPVEQSQFQDASLDLAESWDALSPESGFLGKLKAWFDKNKWAYLVLAMAAPIIARKISDLLANWIGDADEDGDIDPADLLERAAQLIRAKNQNG